MTLFDGYLNILRFRQILRPNKSFHRFPPSFHINPSICYYIIIKIYAFLSANGRLFAIIMVMILLILQMDVLSEKRLELSQTIASLSESVKLKKGCQRYDFLQSIEDENRLYLLEEWDTEENLMNHLKSEHFRVFRGAMNLLKEPCERMFYTVCLPVGIEEIFKQGFYDRAPEEDRQEACLEIRHEGQSGRNVSPNKG